jgi:hypothetical protein
MDNRLAASLLAALGGATALLVPGISQAGNVGYTAMCWDGDPSPQIIAAGHTPVAVATPNAAALASLDALILGCSQVPTNADVNAAVNAGMPLIVIDWSPGAGTAAGSPIISGPGGTLTSTSLDNHNSSYHGHTTGALPAGAMALLTTTDPSQATAFVYGYGAGQVAYSAMPVDASFPPNSDRTGGPGMRTYLTNLVASAMNGFEVVPTTTCASEGYTATKLEWCKNICERGYTGSTLNMWIRRWVERYRQLPYCAVN